jgi:hypothetical protein
MEGDMDGEGEADEDEEYGSEYSKMSKMGLGQGGLGGIGELKKKKKKRKIKHLVVEGVYDGKVWKNYDLKYKKLILPDNQVSLQYCA